MLTCVRAFYPLVCGEHYSNCIVDTWAIPEQCVDTWAISEQCVDTWAIQEQCVLFLAEVQ